MLYILTLDIKSTVGSLGTAEHGGIEFIASTKMAGPSGSLPLVPASITSPG